MGYVIEFRDDEQYGELISKMHKAKKAVCEAFEALERADEMSERNGSYRDGMYRSGGSYREDGRYRDENYRDGRMRERERDGMGRFM